MDFPFLGLSNESFGEVLMSPASDWVLKKYYVERNADICLISSVYEVQTFLK